MLNGKELALMAASEGSTVVLHCLEQALEAGRNGQPGGIKADEFSIRDLFEHIVPDGREAIRYMDPGYGSTPVMEADVDTTLFSNITGQIIYSQILAAYEQEAFVFTKLIPKITTKFLDGEKIAGMGHLGDQAEVVAEGAQYPRDTFGEDYIETPATEKRGNIVSLTKEAIFADRTGLILRRAADIGEWLGVNKEKRLCDIATGATNNYKRKGVSTDTYQTATPWINDHSNPLTDWEDIEKAELLFAGIVDPDTSEPVMLGAMDLVTTAHSYRTAQRILNATEIRHSANGVETLSTNPIRGAYGIHRSQLMYQRLQIAAASGGLEVSAANAKEYSILADFKKAFAYMEVFPLTTVQAPQNSYLSFEKDIVSEYKASERGVGVVMNPRYAVRNKN